MPAFTFEKISPPVRRGPIAPIEKKQRGVIVQILDRFVEARVKRTPAKKGRDRPPRAQATGVGAVVLTEFDQQATVWRCRRARCSSYAAFDYLCAATGCSSPRSADAAAAPARARDRRRSRRAPDVSTGPTGSPAPMARDVAPSASANCRSGLARIFASTRSNGPRLRELRRRESGGADRLHQMAGFVEPRILARDLHRGRIDVARQHARSAAPWPPRWPARRCRCRDRARAAADAPSAHGRAAAGSRAWCRDGRCRTPAPPRSRCRACWRPPARGRAGHARRSARPGPGRGPRGWP